MAKGKKKPKRWRDVLDEVAQQSFAGAPEEDVGRALLRVGLAAACDPDNPSFGSLNRYYADHLVGKATTTVEIQGVQPMGLVHTPEGARLLGVESVQAKVLDADGEVQDVDIDLSAEGE